MLKAVCALSILMMSILINTPLVHAADHSQIHIEIEYGYDGYQKPARSMPVWIRISNDGKAFAGNLTMTILDGDYANMTFSQPVSMLSESKDEFVFYVPCLNPYTNIQITLSDGLKEVLNTTAKAQNQNTDDIYIGVIGTNFDEIIKELESMTLYSPIENAYKGIRPINLMSHSLPDKAEGYEGLDILIVGDINADTLNTSQSAALKSWIENGGLLLTEPVKQSQSFLEKLDVSPIYPESTEKISTDFDASYQSYVYLNTPLSWSELPKNLSEDEISDYFYIISPLDITSENFGAVNPITIDMDILDVSENDQIINERLYQKMICGKGKILVSKFDFSSEAFRNFEASGYVMQQLFDSAVSQADWTHFFNYSDDFQNVWSAQSILLNTINEKLPKLSGYTGIFLIYIVIIGPMIYFLLKRKDRRYLMWITVPATALLFTAVIFAASSNTRHKTPFINYASFLKYTDSKTTEDTFFSATMPDKGQYVQHIPKDYEIHLINNHYINNYSIIGNSSMNNNSGLTYTQTSGNGLNIEVNNDSVFSTRYFNVYQHNISLGNIEENITYQDGHYTGTIKNDTDYPISDAVLLISGKFYRVGLIDAHSETEISFEEKKNTGSDYIVEQELKKVLHISNNETADGEAMVKINMILQCINDNYTNNYPYLFGFMQDYKSEVLTESNVPVNGMSLLQKKININYEAEDGQVYIPNIAQMMIVNSGDIYNMTMTMYSAEAEVFYNFKNSFIPESVELIADSNDSDLEIYAYNYTTHEYDRVFASSNKLSAKKLLDYFGDNKMLRLKFSQKIPNALVSPVLPVISVTGKVS